MKAAGIFEGGGIKGLAHLGAVETMEDAGYQWERLAGTSAGSIVATLLAAGYTGKELIDLFSHFPYERVQKRTAISHLPIISSWLSLYVYNGIYKLSVLEKWMNQTLSKKGILTFGDLPPNKLKIVISDISNNRMAILPDDLNRYGLHAATFPLALAVRISSSIPFSFLPVHLKKHTFLDGSILSNYPVWIFDKEMLPSYPTFGFRLSGPTIVPQPVQVKGPVSKTLAIVRTMMDARDSRFIEENDAVRTIFINTSKSEQRTSPYPKKSVLN